MRFTEPYGFPATKEVKDNTLVHRERHLPLDGVSGVGTIERSIKDRVTDNVHQDRFVSDSTAFLDAHLGGYQMVDTESHPLWLRRKRGEFHGDLGGPFYTLKWWSEVEKPKVTIRNSRSSDPTDAWPSGRIQTDTVYRGPLLPTDPGSMQYHLPFPISSSKVDLDVWGTKAIALCSPSNPTVDLTTALGELIHDGVPAAIGSTLRLWRNLSPKDRRKAIGHEYLNIEFGWKPLISDLQDLCKAILKSDEILRQHEKDSGKMVRRKADFPEESSQSVEVAFQGESPWLAPSSTDLYLPGFSDWGKVYVSQKLSVRRWFSGAFTHFVPEADSSRNAIARHAIQARKLLGISLTPDAVWNLMPWSWAVDWFVDVGDILTNWTNWAIDGQVLLYGYIMEHKLHEKTYTYVGKTGFPGNVQPSGVKMVVETKIRRQATPYGFGLSWDGFSARQIAILTALGLSRS